MSCGSAPFYYGDLDSLPTIGNVLTNAQQLADTASSTILSLAQASEIAAEAIPSLGFTTPTGIAYAAPERPLSRDDSYAEPAVPSTIAYTPPAGFTTPPIPVFTDTLVIDTTGQPGTAPVDDTGAAPSVILPTLPDTPTWVAPTVPTIEGIDVPVFTPLETIDTTIDLPDLEFPELQNGMEYAQTLWESEYLDDMREHIDRVRNGDFAIGAVIWQQIYDRASMQMYREFVARERQGRRAWAAKGWEMPGNAALAMADQAAMEVLGMTVAKRLEVAVQEATQKDEQFWKSMQSGVQIEALYNAAHNQYWERELRFAIAYQEAAIAIYNALAAKYNVYIAVVEAQIASKRLEIENERMKLEAFRAQIEAAIARGEADKLELQLYVAQWDGIRAMVEVYAQQIAAVRENVNAQKLVLEAFGLEVEQYKTKVEAWAKEWDGYSAKMDGEKAKAVVFDSLVKAYAARIDGYDSQVRAAETSAKIAQENAALEIRSSELDIRRYEAQWSGIAAKLSATAQMMQADAAIYRADVDGATAEVNANVSVSRLSLDAATANLQAAIEQAKLAVQAAVESARTAQQAAAAVGNVQAQIAAAAYNSYNFSQSTSLSSAYSTSNQCTTNESTSFQYVKDMCKC